MKSLSTSIFHGVKLINRKNRFLFSEEQKKGNGVFGFIKSAWQQTFPN
jgi:hypothetical protein